MAYEKTIWNTGDMITSEKLNKIENAIEELNLKEGPIGPQGPQGEQGIKGEKGDPGLTPEEKEYLFQSVSNGKSAIAAAITDKGIETAANDTFKQMAQNVEDIMILSEEEIQEAEYWISSDDWSYRYAYEKRSILPNIDNSHVTSMEGLFSECKNLIEVPMINSKKIINTNYMFAGCKNLTNIPLFDTSNVVNAIGMFTGCEKITSLPEFDLSNVTYMTATFRNCKNLIIVPRLNTSKLISMIEMFQSCINLTTIPFLDTSSALNMMNIFSNCHNLTHVRFNPDANNIADFHMIHCTKMTREDIIGMFESLPTLKETRTILMRPLLDKLTDEDKLIAINKGYTLE